MALAASNWNKILVLIEHMENCEIFNKHGCTTGYRPNPFAQVCTNNIHMLKYVQIKSNIHIWFSYLAYSFAYLAPRALVENLNTFCTD